MSREPEEHTMTLWEHLEELRGRIVKTIAAFVIGGGIAWHYKSQLLGLLTRPFVHAWPGSTVASLHFCNASLRLHRLREAGRTFRPGLRVSNPD